MKLYIEKIALSQIGALSVLAKKCFYESYFSNNESEHFYNYVNTHLNIGILTTEWHHAQSSFYFACIDSSPIGFLKLNFLDAQTENHPKDWMEISRIYLLKKFQGLGFGKSMVEFAKEKARQKDVRVIWLGVWPKNLAAIQFYKNIGFEIYGTHEFNFGGNLEEDYLMKYQL